MRHADRSHRPSNQWNIVVDPDAGPAAIPASVVHQVSGPQAAPAVETRNNSSEDLISRGLITLEKAQQYFNTYCLRLDHFLYRILGDEVTLSGVRASSTLLTSAVMTVGALHAASEDFEACYEDFTASVSSMLFSRTNTTEEVRALLIGAFWISGISWTLVGIGLSPLHYGQKTPLTTL